MKCSRHFLPQKWIAAQSPLLRFGMEKTFDGFHGWHWRTLTASRIWPPTRESERRSGDWGCGDGRSLKLNRGGGLLCRGFGLAREGALYSPSSESAGPTGFSQKLMTRGIIMSGSVPSNNWGSRKGAMSVSRLLPGSTSVRCHPCRTTQFRESGLQPRTHETRRNASRSVLWRRLPCGASRM